MIPMIDCLAHNWDRAVNLLSEIAQRPAALRSSHTGFFGVNPIGYWSFQILWHLVVAEKVSLGR